MTEVLNSLLIIYIYTNETKERKCIFYCDWLGLRIKIKQIYKRKMTKELGQAELICLYIKFVCYYICRIATAYINRYLANLLYNLKIDCA